MDARREMKSPILAALLVAGASSGWAHFQELIPSTDIIDQESSRTVELDIVFTHPMEDGPVMNMQRPIQFGVLAGGERFDLLASLHSVEIDGRVTYKASYKVERPGDHVFYLEPAAYWEPAERKMIVHYTKVIVNAFGDEEGWDAPVGFPVEITPLVRPYGLWTGNLFRGIVKKNGQPVPFAAVEVEYRNVGRNVAIPSDPFITQVIRTDANGLFSYAMPKAGWWSFAALMDGDNPMKNPDGKEVDVELGALIWVKCVDMK